MVIVVVGISVMYFGDFCHILLYYNLLDFFPPMETKTDSSTSIRHVHKYVSVTLSPSQKLLLA